jgi:hypothetical protein
MMNKIKSARVHLVKFIFILPLIVMLLAAFRTANHSPLIGIIPSTDTIPSDSANYNLIGITADTVVIHDKNFNKSIIYSGGEEIIVIQNMKTKEIVTMTIRIGTGIKQQMKRNMANYQNLLYPQRLLCLQRRQ